MVPYSAEDGNVERRPVNVENCQDNKRILKIVCPRRTAQ